MFTVTRILGVLAGKTGKRLCVVLLFIMCLCGYQIFPSFLEQPLDEVNTPESFREALLEHASPQRVILLSAGDSGFEDMAVNLYRTSYARFQITNHLFATFDEDLCRVLTSEGANCAQYVQMSHTSEASVFASNDFKRKVYMKTKIVLDALELNMTVVFVDLDIVFLKNPLEYLSCEACDLIIQPDSGPGDMNTGFYLIKPTSASKELMTRAWNSMRTSNPSWSKPQQSQFNAILNKMAAKGQINYVVLDKAMFPNGQDYFLDTHRAFKGENTCTDCVILHNNWSMCKARKRYRFKEQGLWLEDRNGYYSDVYRKYLIYENPQNFDGGGRQTMKAEDRALRTAFTIAHILNRTLILPKFHDGNNLENFGHWYDLNVLDAHYQESYREHVFLENELTPDSVKSSISDAFVIHSRLNEDKLEPESPEVKTLWAYDMEVSVDEIKAWFSGNEHSVLRFYSLYNSVKYDEQIRSFTEQLDKSLLRKVNNRLCFFGFCLWRSSFVTC